MVRRDALLVLNHRFEKVNGVDGHDVHGQALIVPGRYSDLHAPLNLQWQHPTLLDVVVRNRVVVHKRFLHEDQVLLFRHDVFHLLNHHLETQNGVAGFLI